MIEKQNVKVFLLKDVFSSVQTIFSEKKYADKVVEQTLKSHKKWGSRDRKFFAENVYEIVRWWRKLLHMANLDESTMHEWQPAQWEKLWVAKLILFKEDTSGWTVPPLQSTFPNLAIEHSVPDWLYKLCEDQLGARWPAILKSLNEKSTVDLRCNTLRGTRAQLQTELQKEGVATTEIENSEEGLTLIERKNVFITEAFRRGLFEMQDRASQRVGHFLAPRPGDRTIDACAGAGGKSLHIASLQKNKGRVLSLDIHQWKLDELQKRARRDGVSCIETRVIDSTKVIKRLEESADRLLLDVPCTGLGVVRRNPDTKWKLRPESLAEIAQLQFDLLQNYSKMTKIGGRMVYSTCSILPSENENQIEKFLQSCDGKWRLLEHLRIDPDQGLGDGFFAAKLERLS